MKIDILTLFPEMFTGPFSESMIKRAQQDSLVEITLHNIRDYATDKHSTVDDSPYGGGAGMVLMVEPIYNTLEKLKSQSSSLMSHTILLSPQGTKYTQDTAKSLVHYDHLILIAGHYEGFDERIREHLIDEEISIGDYVLTGGELPAMVLTDSIVRLIPGVLGDQDSLVGETHSQKGYKKHPVYTRPETFNSWSVPQVLLSGNHKTIEEWKKNNSR